MSDVSELLKNQQAAFTEAVDALKKESAENTEKFERASKAYLDAKSAADEAVKAAKAESERLNQIEADLKMLGSKAGTAEAKESKRAAAFRTMLRCYDQRHPVPAEVHAALVEGTNADGGYLVVPELDKELGTIIRDENCFRGICGVKTISSNKYEKNVRTSGVGATWVDDSSSISDSATGSVARVSIDVFKLLSVVNVTTDLIEDTQYDLQGEIFREAGCKFAATEQDAFTDGNGTGKPKGVLGNETVADGSWVWGKIGFITSGAAAALGTGADNLIDLTRALKAVYCRNGKFMGTRATLAALMKLKVGANAQNQYLIYQPSFVPGAPDRILGFDYIENSDMAAIGANAFPLLFGDFAEGCTIVDRADTRILVNPYAAVGRIKYEITRRVGFGVTNFEAIKALKIAE